MNPIAEIENMYIKEKYRKRGVGAALVKAVLKLAKQKGARRFRVEVLIKNKSAVKFYRKLGFKDFGLVLEK